MGHFLKNATVLGILLMPALPVRGTEADALAISANIQARHMPFGTVLDPIYASPTSNQIVGYTRCGDSALWTGAYLAAESFRYNVTQSADALNNVKSALAGLNSLSAVTGDNQLARCIVAASSPYAAGIASEEASNTIHQAPPWFWVDNTSRDQIVGAFFGLAVAYDLVNDDTVKSSISNLTTLLLGYISRHQWSPNDDISSTFLLRPEELQMLVQVARHINPSDGISGPFLVPPVDVGVLVDVQSNDSYFKFNLDYMSLYNLIRYQDNSDNRGAYQTVRNYTAPQQNAFFDLVDRALNGPNAARDAETVALLNQWLQRPSRDNPVTLQGVVGVCGSAACQPIPVALRPPDEFLWEESPFQLDGGGMGVIETGGVDYILPYWMARYYGVIQPIAVQSSAAPNGAVTAQSIASVYGSGFAAAADVAGTQPPPQTLDGVTLTVTDSAGNTRNADLMYVAPSQINFVVPAGMAAGAATFTIMNGGATPLTTTAAIQSVAPTLFSMSGDGRGVAAAIGIQVQTANPQAQSPVAVFQCASSGCTSTPIGLSASSTVYLSLYGTGIRNRTSLANVTVNIKGTNVPVLYAGPQSSFEGLDQVNIALPPSLAGSGEVNVVLTVDGQTANVVTVNVQ